MNRSDIGAIRDGIRDHTPETKMILDLCADLDEARTTLGRVQALTEQVECQVPHLCFLRPQCFRCVVRQVVGE